VLACKPESKPSLVKNKNIGNALGTTYAVTFIDKEQKDFQREIDSIFSVFNKSLSTYLPDSDISKINNGDTKFTFEFKNVNILLSS
jgi:thiamine biosynthesis lipoprotein